MPTVGQLRLLAALEDPYRAMAEVALYGGGMRISEIRGLQWSDVGPQAVVVRRRVSKDGDIDVLKNGKTKVLDIRPIAPVLARIPREGDYIFAEAGCYSSCQQAMVRARKLAGIQTARFSWHHLRAILTAWRAKRAQTHRSAGDDGPRVGAAECSIYFSRRAKTCGAAGIRFSRYRRW